ncbi:hypothetical protein L1887_16565 [Cichorium endivia]|nr:hypothetical protein L1887_16565 [Cichorium endivia]
MKRGRRQEGTASYSPVTKPGRFQLVKVFSPPTPTRAKPTYAISPFFKTLSSINASSSSLSLSLSTIKLSLNHLAVFRSDALSSQVPFDLIPNLFSVS